MTTLDVTLSAGFQGEVGAPGNGAWVYAIAYDTYDTAGVVTTLVADGTVAGGGTVPVTLLNSAVAADTAFVSGKVYFVIEQSSGTPDTATQFPGQSSLNITNAAADHFVFDSVEMNLSGLSGAAAAYDVANLTSVAGFTLPMEISVPYSTGTTATVGYSESGDAIISNLTANEGNPTSDVRQFLTGSLAGDFATALSPAAVISTATPNPSGVTFQSTNWANYVQAVGSLANTASIVLSGIFNGAVDANGTYHNGGYFAYDVTYDPTATLDVNGTTVETGVIMLVPTANSEIKGVIALGTPELENSIYSTLGTAEIFADTADVLSGTVAAAYTVNTGANDQWGGVLRSLLVGFSAGYYGGSGASPNPQLASRIDLDNSVNWDPSYAFRGNPIYEVTNAITVTGTGQVAYDPYAQVFFAKSNSYGAGYSDALTSAYQTGGPLIPVYDPGTSLDVSTINLTLFAQSETPHGYTTPTIDNYIQPASGTYDVPNATTTGANIDLSAAVGGLQSAGIMLNPAGTVTLGILTADTGGTAEWSTVTLDGSADIANGGLWRQWTIEGNATSGYTAVASGTANTAGNVGIDDLPVSTASTATEWYRIGVGGKTFDLYAVTQGGSFENPSYTSANQAGAIAVDGLAMINLPAATSGSITIPTFTVNLNPAGALAIDPSQLVVSSALPGTQPDAPVAGTFDTNGTFEALANQTAQATNDITVAATGADLAVAFGWTGLNNAPGASASSWIGGYTNKVGALDTVEVTITPAGGGTAQTVDSTADLDGNWQTGTVELGAGSTYDVTMSSYMPGVSGALTPESQKLTLDVTCFVAGTRILTARGEVAVEELIVGERVMARGARLAEIRWIGRRHVDCHRHANPRDVAPVRVLRGAFGPNVPHRDLLLSPDHAVFADGVLIPVRYLVNGRTVRREVAQSVTYYHVELAHHDVILADGLACESYLDTGNRATFDNAMGTKASDDVALGVWARDSCAPLVLKGEKLAGVRRHLLARAEELGHAMTRDPALRVVVDGRALRPQRAGRVARFRLPAAARDVRLVSRSGVPAQTAAGAEDHRQLGVGVSAIKVDGQAIALDDTRLGRGWHRLEHGEGGEAWRWTDGDANLALTGGNLLEVEVALTEAYWQDA